jgi:hypothetical protein
MHRMKCGEIGQPDEHTWSRKGQYKLRIAMEIVIEEKVGSRDQYHTIEVRWNWWIIMMARRGSR